MSHAHSSPSPTTPQAPLARFDARRYLTKLKGQDYLEVKWRLLWLRTEHPDAVIETELVRWEPDPPMALFRARVSIPGGGSATGWGQEELKDFGDFLEKSETKALGRALAALGYGTQFTTDFDFAEGDSPRVVDAPVPPRAPTPSPRVPPRAAEAELERLIAAGVVQVTDAGTSPAAPWTRRYTYGDVPCVAVTTAKGLLLRSLIRCFAPGHGGVPWLCRPAPDGSGRWVHRAPDGDLCVMPAPASEPPPDTP